jgi:hypothetical protein
MSARKNAELITAEDFCKKYSLPQEPDDSDIWRFLQKRYEVKALEYRHPEGSTIPPGGPKDIFELLDRLNVRLYGRKKDDDPDTCKLIMQGPLDEMVADHVSRKAESTPRPEGVEVPYEFIWRAEFGDPEDYSPGQHCDDIVRRLFPGVEIRNPQVEA